MRRPGKNARVPDGLYELLQVYALATDRTVTQAMRLAITRGLRELNRELAKAIAKENRP